MEKCDKQSDRIHERTALDEMVTYFLFYTMQCVNRHHMFLHYRHSFLMLVMQKSVHFVQNISHFHFTLIHFYESSYHAFHVRSV